MQHAGKCTFLPQRDNVKITGLKFIRLLTLMHFGTCMKVSVFGLKGQRSRSQHDQGSAVDTYRSRHLVGLIESVSK